LRTPHARPAVPTPSVAFSTSNPLSRVAVDLLGGDGAPEVVADAVLALIDEPGIDLVLVGPSAVAAELLAARGIDPSRVAILHADSVVPMDADPLALLRESDSYSVSVAATAVRDGNADAWVTVGHTGAAVAAAAFTLGRVPGMTRPALAVVLPATHGPVVLVDAGAVLDATADTLLHFALAGWCYAHALDIADPGIGLLSIGSEPGKGDVLRSVTDSLLRQILPGFGMRYAGLVEGHDVSRGDRAQVIVTDGFTGNVLLKGIEGAVTWAAARLAESYGDSAPARRLVSQTATGDFAGGMLLGVNGVTVIGHGAGSAAEIAACIRLAARVAKHDIIAETQRTFSALVSTP